MFYKKISVIMLITLAAFSGALFGCKNVYENLSLELSETEITLYLNDEINTETGEVVDNSKTFTAKVSGAEEGVLTNVTFSQTNKNAVSIEALTVLNGVTTIRLTPISAGYSEITVHTSEGKKEKKLSVTVIEEISNLETLDGYVMPIVKGETKQVDATNSLIFYPDTTNQKEVTYSINGFYTPGINSPLESMEGVSITEDGVLTVEETSSIDAGTICEINVVSDYDSELTTTIDALIIETIQSFEIGFPEGVIENNKMSLATNRTEYSTVTAITTVTSNLSYKIEAVIENESIISAQIEKDYTGLTIYGLGSGVTTVKFVAYLVDYPEYRLESETITVYVAQYPEQVVTNGIYNKDNHAYTIYDYYVGGVLGQELLLEVAPIGAFNRNVILKMAQPDIDAVSVYFSDGTEVAIDALETTEIEGEYLASGTTVYVKANESGSSVMLYAESAGSSEKVDNIELNLSKGIESINLSTGASLETETTSIETVNVNISPAGAVFDDVQVYSSDTSVVAVTDLVDGTVSDLTFDITPVGPGNATVVVKASNGVEEFIDVNVYVNLTDISLMLDSPAENSEVGERNLEDDSVEGCETLESATVAIGAGLFLNVLKEPENATIKNITYSALLESGVNATDYVSVNNNGYMSIRAVADEAIIVTVTAEDYSGAIITESFELYSYIPIESLTLNTTSASLLASSTVGYYDLDESTLQLSAYIAPVNATFNYDSIVWSSSNEDYATVVDGYVTVDIPEDVDGAIVEIKVEIVEFDRRYIQTCSIEITKPKSVKSITIRNVDTVADHNYLCFDGRDGLGESFESLTSFQIDALAYPLDSTNTNLRYEYIQDEYDTNQEPVVVIRDDGTVVPMRAGVAEIYIVAEDSYNKEGDFLDENGYPIGGLVYEIIQVKVADGLSEETAIEIASVEDFVAINNTSQSLGLYYVLVESINFSNTEIQPIGLLNDGSIFEIDGEKAGFYGHLSGSLIVGNSEISSRIYGLELSENEMYDVNDDGVYSSEVTDAYYLGLFAYNTGTLIDLDVEILDLSSSYISKGSDNNAYIGGLVAYNAGIVENVELSLQSSYIKTVHINNYVGALVGYNDKLDDTANIVDVKVRGNLYVNQKISSNPSTVAIGGIAGYNNGVIDGGFDFYDGSIMLGATEINCVMNITVENKLPKLQGVGGIVGVNAGTIQNMSSQCEIVANTDKFEIDEVVGYGGIAGIVEINGLVDKCYVSGSIYAPENVGGIVGRLSGIVSNCILEILDYEDETDELRPAIIGYNYVGGIAGRISDATSDSDGTPTSGAVMYSYIRSYVSRDNTDMNNGLYSGDIYVISQSDITSDICVGGIAGYANEAIIMNSYSHLNIVVTNTDTTSGDGYTPQKMYVGGILGSTDGSNNVDIFNVYSRGSIVKTVNGTGAITDDAFIGYSTTTGTLTLKYSYTTLSYFNGSDLQNNSYVLYSESDDSTNKVYSQPDDTNIATLGDISDWSVNANYNNGYPILTDSNANVMVVDVPDSITVTVDASFEDDTNTTVTTMKNKHYKKSDNEAVLYYYVLDGADDVEKNIYRLSYIDDDHKGMVAITATPASVTGAKMRAIVEISDESIIQYDSSIGYLMVYAEGVVNIKIIPLLNKDIAQEFIVYVVKPVIEFNCPANSTINKDNTQRIYPEIENYDYELNGSIEIKYEITSGSSNSLKFENYAWSSDVVYIPLQDAHILDARVKYDVTLKAIPVIYVNGVREELEYLTKTFTIKVTEGVTDLELSLEDASISLQDILTIEATAVTDIPDSSAGDYTKISCETITRTTSDLDGSVITAVDATNEITIDFSTLKEDVGNNLLQQEISIEIADKTKSMYNYTQTYEIQIVAYDVVDGDEGAVEYTTTLILNIIPQELFRMDLDYYAYSQVYENSNEEIIYNPNEMPSESILAGQAGILQIGLFPDYANIDYVDLKTSLGDEITLLQQSVAVESTETIGKIEYSPISPDALAIRDGIRMSLESNEISGKYNFDGNLYARILIPATATVGSDFEITVTAYYKSGEMALTTTKNLTVEMPSSISIDYNGQTEGYYAIGTVQDIGIALTEWEGDITWEMTVDGVTSVIPMVDSADISTDSFDIRGNTVSDGSYSYDYVFVNNSTKIKRNDDDDDEGSHIAMIKYSNTSYKLYVSTAYGASKEIVITAEFTKIIDNKEHLYKSHNLTLTTALYTVQDIDIEDADYNSTWTKAYGGYHNLEINAVVIYNSGVSNILNEISNFEVGISTSFNSWYTRDFLSASYSDSVLALGNYDNYKITQLPNIDSEDKSQVPYIRLQPTVITSGDVLVGKIKFSYTNGKPTADISGDLSGETDIISGSNIIMTEAITTEFYLKAGENSAIPIATQTDLLDMYELGSYRLNADIVLENWTPLDVAISYFDGNGYTITIESFDSDYMKNTEVIETAYVGLFGTVYEGTTIVNLEVVYDSNLETTEYVSLSLENYSYVSVGGVAGYNEAGVIYNCSTKGRINLTPANVADLDNVDVYFGGLIGQNDGYITNSMSYMDLETSFGYIGGLVGKNAGTIASSFYKTGVTDHKIKNTSEATLGSGVGGLVAINDEDAVIRYCYVEGFEFNSTTYRYSKGGIISNGSIGGFAYENLGTIEDSYSNIAISTQESASGFVYDNSYGYIVDCYSASTVEENNDSQSPFIGKSSSGYLLSNNDNVDNCYYLEGSYPNSSAYVSFEILEVNFGNKDSYAGFKFDLSDEGTNGIWVIANSDGVKGGSNSYVRLQSTLIVAQSSKTLDGFNEDEVTGLVEYSWIDSENSYAEGTEQNPIIITSAQDYNEKITENDYFRIVCDFDFGNDDIIPKTYNMDYTGTLEGNGMTISNLTINTSMSENVDNISKIGMFRCITGTIKNLNLEVIEANASNVETVGILAGSINGGSVYNINITTDETMVVQGRNIVGGVAGIIEDGSILCDITVQAAISSGYRNNMGKYIGYYIYNSNGDNNDVISYAGAIAGVVESSSDTAKIQIENVSVYGDSTIMSENAGGLFGLLGNYATANNVSIEIIEGQIIRGEKVSGGIAAESRGIITNAKVDYTKDNREAIQEAYDNGHTNQGLSYREDVFYDTSSIAVGGLVGFNNGGDIARSCCGIDVRNQEVDNAGGLVGMMSGGTIIDSEAKGSVLSLYNIGGIIGLASNKESLYSNSGYFELSDNVEDALVSKTANISDIESNNLWLGVDENLRYSYQNENDIFEVRVGGILGAVDKTVNEENITWNLDIFNCTNIANINGYYVGGIVGSNENGERMTIRNCYNSGKITGISAGGILGYVSSGSANIYECVNSGNIKSLYTGIDGASNATLRCVGGIAGKMVGDINNCYNNANVSMEGDPDSLGITSFTFSVGGIAGYSDGTYAIENCYNVGKIVYDAGLSTDSIIVNSGSIVGEDGVVNNCYSLEFVIQQTKDDTLTEINDIDSTVNTEALMQNEDTYSGFDFTSGGVWVIGSTVNNGFPVLQAFNPDIVVVTFYDTGETRTILQGDIISVNNMPSNPSKYGYTFTGWGTTADSNDFIVDGAESANVDSNLTVYAVYDPLSFNVSVSISSDTNAEVDGNKVDINSPDLTSEDFYFDTAGVTINATDDIEGYIFSRWLLNGVEVSTESTYTFDLNVAQNYVFVAEYINAYIVSVTGDHSTVSVSDGIDSDGSGSTSEYFVINTLGITVTATDINSEYIFHRWMLNGTEVSTEPTYTFNLDVAQNYTFVAEYTNIYYVNVSGDHGTVSVSDGIDLDGSGSTSEYFIINTSDITVTATDIDGGYGFYRWLLNGVEVSTESTYTFDLDVAQNYSFVAEYLNIYTVTVSSSNGSVFVSDGIDSDGNSSASEYFYYGTNGIMITTTTNSPEIWEFYCWELNGNWVSYDQAYTFNLNTALNYNFVAVYTRVLVVG